MSWNIKTPGDYINGPLTVAGSATITGALAVDTTTLVANAAGYTDKVGVGTATPAATLNVKGSVRIDADYNVIYAHNDAGTLIGYTLFRDSGPNYVNVNSNQPLYLSTNNTVNVQVETSGDVKINTGNVVMGTSGKGIDFSATAGTGTSELLNDYEEGTFTPTITNGATAVTYSTNAGTYTKVGRLVTVIIQITTSASTLNAGQLTVSGLPFVSSNFSSGVIGYSNNGFIAAVGGNKPNLYLSGSYVEFYTSSGTAFLGTTLASSVFDVRFTATYFV